MSDRPFDLIRIVDPPGPSWRDSLERTRAFCTVSLGDWLDAVRRAGVPHVPAERVGDFEIEALLNYDRPGAHDAELSRFGAAVEGAAEPDFMLRWDVCASSEVKWRLGEGRPRWHADFLKLMIDDPRAYDLIYEFPRDLMPVWKRPWIRARIVEGWPVEFRVFVKDGIVVGAASYYPQRDLPETAEFLDLARRAMGLTEAVIARVPCPVWVPPDGGAGRWRPDVAHGTCDWLLAETGELLWLEGGPPFGAGAHPCAFLGRDGISGIAFATHVPKEDLT